MSESVLKIGIPGPLEDTLNYYYALGLMDAKGVELDFGDDLNGLDGLILPGGCDIDPIRYGEENIACGHIDRDLDRRQFDVLERFIPSGKPVFGICRGLQLLNVFFGGSLIQHLDTAPTHAREAEYLDDPGNAYDKVHLAHAVSGSLPEELYGTTFSINSAHHQAIKALGKGLEIQMTADDGTIEAVRHIELPVFALQWHPERMTGKYLRSDTVDGRLILQRFIEQCRKMR